MIDSTSDAAHDQNIVQVVFRGTHLSECLSKVGAVLIWILSHLDAFLLVVSLNVWFDRIQVAMYQVRELNSSVDAERFTVHHTNLSDDPSDEVTSYNLFAPPSAHNLYALCTQSRRRSSRLVMGEFRMIKAAVDDASFSSLMKFRG